MRTGIKPRIGFVILVWNSERVISNCLQSIVSLSKIQAQVVIVDNGSSDKTVEIVQSFESNYSEMIEHIHFDTNKGTTISRNEGLKRLSNRGIDYYCVLDSDTVINDDAFLKMIDEMERNPQYGVIGPEMTMLNGAVQMSARSFPTLLEKLYKGIPIKTLQKKGEAMEIQVPKDPTADSYPVDYLMSACWVIRPNLLNVVGYLDEKIYYAPEDAEYCIRVWKAGYQVAYCPSATIVHEWQRLSKKKLISIINWEHIKGLAYMFKKHHYCFSTKRLKRQFPT